MAQLILTPDEHARLTAYVTLTRDGDWYTVNCDTVLSVLFPGDAFDSFYDKAWPARLLSIATIAPDVPQAPPVPVRMPSPDDDDDDDDDEPPCRCMLCAP